MNLEFAWPWAWAGLILPVVVRLLLPALVRRQAALAVPDVGVGALWFVWILVTERFAPADGEAQRLISGGQYLAISLANLGVLFLLSLDGLLCYRSPAGSRAGGLTQEDSSTLYWTAEATSSSDRSTRPPLAGMYPTDPV